MNAHPLICKCHLIVMGESSFVCFLKVVVLVVGASEYLLLQGVGKLCVHHDARDESFIEEG